MICEIVSYPAPPGLDRDGMIEDAQSVVPKWQAERDLTMTELRGASAEEAFPDFLARKGRGPRQ